MTTNAVNSDTYAKNDPAQVPSLPEISGDIIPGPGASNGASLPVHHFDWHGRQYRLYKREADKAAPWYFQIKRAGKRFACSTKTPVVSVAITKAKAILEADSKHQLAEVRAVLNPKKQERKAWCTVGQLLDTLDRTVLDIGEKHRTGIRSAIGVVLRDAIGADEIEGLSTWILNEQTARAYFARALAKARSQAGQVDQARVKRSANSTWCQAVCLFRPKLISAYRAAGLEVPDLAPFLDVFKEEKFSKCAATYNPPADTVIRATVRAWAKLADRNQFLAAGLALACGLRRGELAQLTWSMLTRRNGAPVVDGRMDVKNQSGRLTVQPIDPFWRVMMRRVKREGWQGKPDETVLVGTDTDIKEDIYRDLGAWLRGLGWQTEKTTHALRAYAGSLVAMKWGIFIAQRWLRHNDVKVTQRNYSHFIDSAVFDPDKVRVAWAK